MVIPLQRRRFLAGLLSTSSLPLLATSSSREGRKGWGGGDAEQHKLFDVHWYYNWMPRETAPESVEFVPMIKGLPAMDSLDKIKELPGITHLLGFNEPERESQGDVPLEKALELWPQLEALAAAKNLRLSSPAPSSDQKGMTWFNEFMEQAKRRKLRIDFIAVHWYRSRDPGAFEAFVESLAKEHRIPVWVTEFNGWSGTEDENYDFLKDSLRFLERSRYVERYAYFNPAKGQPHSLLAEDGSLTRMGELYRDT